MNDPVNDPEYAPNPVILPPEITSTVSVTIARLALTAYDAETVKDDEIATDDDCAQLLVPNVDPLCVPINDPVKEPVLTLNVIDVAALAVVVNDAEVTKDAVNA